MNEWKEGVWLAIGAFITAMLITFAVVLGSVSQNVARMQQSDINVVTSLEEYRKWVKYDDATVNQGDVINCILENRTQVPAVAASTVTAAPGVTYPPFPPSPCPPATPYPTNPPYPLVTLPPGAPFVGYYLWDGTKWDGSNVYSADALNACIPPGATYKAKLVKDANGAVLYIWFRRIT